LKEEVRNAEDVEAIDDRPALSLADTERVFEGLAATIE
jgi:hypothetical protein